MTFKNVLLNVPDEEILTLCACYGKAVDNKVHYEKLNNIRGRGLTGSTRYVDMQLNQGTCFENYYWMEGPLPGDQGKRIVVLHNGQTTQCSHCLRRAGAGCPAMGIGKACELAGTPRAKMNNYMQGLRSSIGYVSMKIKYIEKQARMFPSLIGLPGEKSSEQEVAGAWEMEETESHAPILNPIEERDKLIVEQRQELEKLRLAQTKSLKVENELVKLKKENLVLNKKINFTRKATEEKIFENISNKDFYREDPFCVAVLSATLNEDDIDLESGVTPISDNQSEHVSRKQQFLLASLESKIDHSDELQTERLSHIKDQVLEKLKTTKERRQNSKRRYSCIGIEEQSRSSSRPRISSPNDNLQ